MRIPGIQTIAYIDAAQITQDMELSALSGLAPDITALSFTPVLFVGEPTLELSDSNEHNGTNHQATLNFSVPYRFTPRRVAFILTAASGAIYLLGSQSFIPAISTKDTTAGPGTANLQQVTVELSAPVAWIQVDGEGIYLDTPAPVGYEHWRPMTSEEIDEIINSIKPK